MAPPRRKGANTKGKVRAELSLGDLVLAKVKGFPPWPAKISKPEEWEQTPDPKKYFVQFFGTNEIGFVSPVDVQPFTIELKKMLQARSKKKTVKYFAQALDEICEAFEESEPKESGSLGDYVVSNPDLSSSLDGVEANELEHNVGDNGEVVGNASSRGSSLEHCSSMQEGAASKKKNYAGELGFSKERILKGCLATASHSDDQTIDGKKADLAVCNERMQSARTSASPYGCDNPSVDLTNRKKSPAKQKSSTDGYGSKGFHSERKRKFDDVHDDRARSGGHPKDGVLHTISSSKLDKHPSGYKVNKVMKDKKPHDIIKICQEDALPSSKVYGEALPPKEKNSSHVRSERTPVGVSERSDSSKRKKPIDLVNDANKRSSLKNEKRDSLTLRVSDGGLEKNSENKGSICTKAEEDHLHSKPPKCSMPSDVPPDEAVTPSVKRRRVIVPNSMYDPIKPASDDKRSSFSSIQKSDVTKKRRAIRLCDDDDEDDIPKTPVHGSSARKLNSSSSILESLQTNVHIQGNCFIGQTIKGTSKSGEAFAKLSDPNAKSCCDSASVPEISDKSKKVHSPSQKELDTNKQMPDSSKVEFVSPTTSSPCIIPAADKNMGEQSISKHQVKVSETVAHSKGQSMSFKGLHLGSDGSNYLQTQVAPKKNRQLSSGEKPKVTPKSQGEIDPAVSGRLENVRKDRGSSLEESKMDSELSMKHLIAAAQAKRKQAQMQNLLQSNMLFDFGNTESPSVEHQFISGGNNLVQVGFQEIHSRTSFASPTGHASQGVSQNQAIEEHDDNRPDLGQQGDSGSLSGGTEAAVARDAFEGMIETLTRTKESIGRATRLAVECAKYGIADEVVDLLIRKLESEPIVHRKVDIFFLVDSITQCSHNQKGIAGASYVPAVQAALSRLLGAAAPAGPSARENRRQCLKVLRLWLERKILPESVLRHHMDSIRASIDDISNGCSFKRPSRAERSVDDPIREMEGMLVDEYGSNATFQLSGFFPSHGFVIDEEDGEDMLSTPCVGVSVEFAETTREPEACVVTPSDKRHHILEDVDVELEMEDVSGHQEDEIAVSTSWSSEIYEHVQSAERERNHATYIEVDSMTPIGSPPLPLEPPPPQPPLPESPPPPLPPSCPPSPPPPPPSPPVHPPFPPQLSFPSQSSSQHPMPEGFCSMPGNQIGQMAGNAPEQSSSFITAFSQGPFHPIPPNNILTPSNLFPYNKPAVQQHVEHPNQHSYPSPSIADNRMRFVADDPRAMINGGSNPSRLTAFYGAEGYYRPPTERPPSNNLGFQYSAPNMVVQAGVPIHGHGNGHMLPSRPDMSALNCWRPT